MSSSLQSSVEGSKKDQKQHVKFVDEVIAGQQLKEQNSLKAAKIKAAPITSDQDEEESQQITPTIVSSKKSQLNSAVQEVEKQLQQRSESFDDLDPENIFADEKLSKIQKDKKEQASESSKQEDSNEHKNSHQQQNSQQQIILTENEELENENTSLKQQNRKRQKEEQAAQIIQADEDDDEEEQKVEEEKEQNTNKTLSKEKKTQKVKFDADVVEKQAKKGQKVIPQQNNDLIEQYCDSIIPKQDNQQYDDDNEATEENHLQGEADKDQKSKSFWFIQGTKTGRFSKEELKSLKDGICHVAAEQNWSVDELKDFLQESSSHKNQSFWLGIARYLPGRSLGSIYNFLFRKLESNNHKGRWTKQDEARLMELVALHGTQFKVIGKELGRTGWNCSSKYRQLGKQNSENRSTISWNVRETIKLIRKIERDIKLRFLHEQTEAKLYGDEIENESFQLEGEPPRIPLKELSQLKGTKTKFYEWSGIQLILRKYIDFDAIKDNQFEGINWSQITQKMGDRSWDDCRNHFNFQILPWLLEARVQDYEEQDDEILVQAIYDMGAEDDFEIDFSKINNGQSVKENKQRWAILKKQVSSRAVSNFSEIIQTLKKKIQNKQNIYSSKKKNGKPISNNLLNVYKEYIEVEEEAEEQDIE